MTDTRRAKLIIRYVNGQSNTLVFSQIVGAADAMKRIEEAMDAQCLVLELEDRAMLIPLHQIKSLEVFPAPEKLPKYTLRSVSFLE